MNNEITIKVSKFREALKRSNMDTLFKEINNDKVTAFVADQKMHNAICKVIIFVNASIYNEGTIIFATLDDVGKKEQILSLLNDLNKKYVPFKFAINDNNEIFAQLCYIADSNKYEAYDFLETIVDMYSEIKDSVYKKIMRIIWA